MASAMTARSVRFVLAAAQVAPASVDLKTPPPMVSVNVPA